MLSGSKTQQSSLSSKWSDINNSVSDDINNFVSYDEFQNLITEFNKLYEKVENIYDFCKQVQVFIPNNFVNI